MNAGTKTMRWVVAFVAAVVLSCSCLLAGCSESGSAPGSSSAAESASADAAVSGSEDADGESASAGQSADDGESASASESESSAESAASAADEESAATTTLLGPSPAWVTSLPEAAEADQLFVVAAYGQTTARISMHEKDSTGQWQTVMMTPGFVGRSGIGKTMEGDALTPQGSFTFDRAFGIAPDPGCKMTYTQVTDDLYWSGDHGGGMHYNQMVSINDYPGLDTANSEHLIDYTREYQYCLNISFNPDCIPGNGAAIFLHCFGAAHPYTGGCVAIPEDQMKVVMQHVEPGCAVVIDTIENLGAPM